MVVQTILQPIRHRHKIISCDITLIPLISSTLWFHQHLLKAEIRTQQITLMATTWSFLHIVVSYRKLLVSASHQLKIGRPGWQVRERFSSCTSCRSTWWPWISLWKDNDEDFSLQRHENNDRMLLESHTLTRGSFSPLLKQEPKIRS